MPKSRSHQLDGIINAAVDRARESGYSLRALRDRALSRLLEEPPDHVLVIEPEPALRSILQAEIFAALRMPVESCALSDLERHPELALGAQVAAPEYAVDLLLPHLPQSRPCMPLTFSAADEHVASIRALTTPSTIGVASVSKILLKTARGLLAPAVARRHTFQQFLLSPNQSKDLRNVDILFCDTLAMPALRGKNKIPYRLIASKSLDDLAAIFRPTNG